MHYPNYEDNPEIKAQFNVIEIIIQVFANYLKDVDILEYGLDS